MMCICLSSVSAQELIEDIGFGIEVYPHLSNRRLLGGNNVTFAETARIDSLEKADFGYGLGIFYAQRIEKIGFHIGLRYFQTGYQTNEEELITNPPQDVPTTFSQVYTAQMLEVPFQLNFFQNFGSNTSFYFTIGLAAGVHLKSQLKQTNNFSGGSTTAIVSQDVDYRRINFAMITGVGIERRFKKITIGLQPTFEYWLSGNTIPNDASQLTRNLYNVGLRMTGQFSTY